MKNRCNNPRAANYARYGGRGITYCDDWTWFEMFARDMLPTWQPGLQLDRIDNDGPYCKENCHWTTPTENSRNRPSNVLTLEQAEQIRAFYATGNYSQRELAYMFSTSHSNIAHTLHYRQWKTS
jgi:hypothetical protein